jgi:hypothetical protein
MASDFVSYEDAVESFAKIFNSTTDRRKDDEVKIIFEKTGQNLLINQLLKKTDQFEVFIDRNIRKYY